MHCTAGLLVDVTAMTLWVVLLIFGRYGVRLIGRCLIDLVCFLQLLKCWITRGFIVQMGGTYHRTFSFILLLSIALTIIQQHSTLRSRITCFLTVNGAAVYKMS